MLTGGIHQTPFASIARRNNRIQFDLVFPSVSVASRRLPAIVRYSRTNGVLQEAFVGARHGQPTGRTDRLGAFGTAGRFAGQLFDGQSVKRGN